MKDIERMIKLARPFNELTKPFSITPNLRTDMLYMQELANKCNVFSGSLSGLGLSSFLSHTGENEPDIVTLSFLSCVEKFGYDGTGMIEFLIGVFERAHSEGKNPYASYEYLIGLAERQLANDIKGILTNLHAYLESVYESIESVTPDKLVFSIRTFFYEKRVNYFTESDSVVIGKNYGSGPFYSNRDIYPLIQDGIIMRKVRLPYRDDFISFLREHETIVVASNTDKPSRKKGPRNKKLYSRVVSIVDKTLPKFPGATTYALTDEIEKLLTSEGGCDISPQTLSRWITGHRKETKQEPKGKHKGRLKLVL